MGINHAKTVVRHIIEDCVYEPKDTLEEKLDLTAMVDWITNAVLRSMDKAEIDLVAGSYIDLGLEEASFASGDIVLPYFAIVLGCIGKYIDLDSP